MGRHTLSWSLSIALVLGGTAAAAIPLGELRDALKQRYPISRIEIENSAYPGTVVLRGAVLALEPDGVPANTFRTIRTNTKSPRFHVRDYATVEITADGVINAGPGEFRLPKGTRLVVLDVTAEADRVRLFTHTVAPVMVEGRPVYGCTEFVFRFGPSRLERSDLVAIERTIERWLPFAAS